MSRIAQTSLAVIGCGISGLTAARVCQKAGMAVTLYDKGRGVGGRCATRRRDDFAFDHGAQLIGATDGKFRGEVRNWMMSTAVQRWKGQFQGLPNSMTPFVGAPGMNALPKMLAQGLNIYLPVEISEVVAEPDNQWGLLDAEGRLLGSYDAVLITCPPEQAHNLAGAVLGPEVFDRPVTMRAVWTVMAAFQRPLNTGLDGIVMDGEPLTWAARNSTKPRRDAIPETWVLHAGSDVSEQFIDHPREEVVGDLLAAFEHWLNEPLPTPSYATAHRWRYANAEGRSLNGEKSYFDASLGLALAGDWINPPVSHHYGIQSAWQSGMEAGERLKSWAKAR